MWGRGLFEEEVLAMCGPSPSSWRRLGRGTRRGPRTDMRRWRRHRHILRLVIGGFYGDVIMVSLEVC